MLYEWDDEKDDRNRIKHGVAFEAIEDFVWASAITYKDERRNYGEYRYVGYGYIHNRLHVCVYTQRENTRRIISLRRANSREESLYEKAIKTALN